MKKILSFLILVACSFCALAQSGKVYCELVGTQQLLSKKVNVSVDFGQETKLFSNETMVDDSGKAIVFNSMVDAMNYMGKSGWEFEQAYVVTVGTGSGASNVYHWLLSKFVGDEDQPIDIKTKASTRRAKEVPIISSVE